MQRASQVPHRPGPLAVRLADLGNADRWSDLAIATWSAELNYGPGWQNLLLDSHGIQPDADRTQVLPPAGTLPLTLARPAADADGAGPGACRLKLGSVVRGWRAILGAVTTVLRGDQSHLDGAAQVWAEATAARDGDPEVAPLDLSRPVIASALGRPGALLFVVLDEHEQVAAFAVAGPPPSADPESSAGTAEVYYLGVRPSLWGTGLGRGVLRFLCAELAVAGFAEAQLLVYVSNARAARMYDQLGWQPQGLPAPHPRTGKPEQRYRLRLSR